MLYTYYVFAFELAAVILLVAIVAAKIVEKYRRPAIGGEVGTRIRDLLREMTDLFVEALRPTMASLRISEAFVGLVVVAIAGNAVENVVGVQMAIRNKADLAASLILNSSLQVAIALTPALVLISLIIGGGLTLVLSPLLLGAVALSAILAALIVFDGESTWLEGLALLGLYVIIAASVWYGPPIRT